MEADWPVALYRPVFFRNFRSPNCFLYLPPAMVVALTRGHSQMYRDASEIGEKESWMDSDVAHRERVVNAGS
jgi:hypothetical protein